MKKEIVMELKGKEWESMLDHVWEHKKKDVQIDEVYVETKEKK